MDSRTRKVMLALVAAAVLAAPLAAQAQAPVKPAASIEGTWDMTVTGPDGNPMQVTATFKQAGTKLTGTLIGPAGEVALAGDYAEGKVNFGITIPQDSGPMDIRFAGTMKDDGALGGIATGPFGDIPWVAVKRK